MSPRAVILSALFAVLAVTAACATNGNDPDSEQTVSAVQVEIRVNTIEVQQTAYDPAQIVVAVEGVVGDSCNQLAGVQQERTGNAIDVTITAIRTVGIECMELAQVYNEAIPLEGEFMPGNYTVTVNGVSQDFTVVSHLGDAESTARRALAADLGIQETAPILISIEEVLWGDSSLGCPEPGMMYAQVITPGFRLVFEHSGQRFEYHTNRDGSVGVSCEP